MVDDQNCLYAKGAALTQGMAQTPPVFSDSADPASIRDAAGILHFFCIDGEGSLWTIQQLTANGAWGRWTALGAPSGATLQSLVVNANQDGRLQVFALDSANSVRTVYQVPAGNSWSGWSSLAVSDPSVQDLVVRSGGDGCLHLFAYDSAGAVWHIDQTAPNGGWGSWTSLGAPIGSLTLSGLTVEQNQDGRLEAFVLITGSIYPPYHIYQTSPGGPWSSWQALPAIPLPPPLTTTDLRAAQNADGHLELFVLVQHEVQMVAHIWQQAPNQGWESNWSILGGAAFADGSLSVARNESGTLEVFVLGAGSLSHCYQDAPNGGWSGWSSLGAPANTLQSMSVVCDAASKLEIFAMGADRTAWSIAQGVGSGGWTNWVPDWWTWYPIPGAPPLTTAPSGSAGAFWCIGASGQICFFDGVAWSALSLPNSDAAQYVSLDAEGTLWVLAGSGSLYRYAQGSFEAMPGTLPGANSFSASSAANIWATAANTPSGNDYTLYRYTGAGWQAVQTPRLEYWTSRPQVSVASDGTVWILDGGVGAVWKRAFTDSVEPWVAKSSNLNLQSIAAANVNPGAYLTPVAQAGLAVSAEGVIWRNNGGAWLNAESPLPAAAVPAQISATADGSVWAIDTAGVLYRKGTWNSPDPAPAAATGLSPAAARNSAGLLQTVCFGAAGKLWGIAQTSSNGAFGGWSQLNAPLEVDGAVFGQSAGGGLLLFAFGEVSADDYADYGVCVAAEDGNSASGWGPWTPIGRAGIPGGIQLNTFAIGSAAQKIPFAIVTGQNSQGQTSIFQAWPAGSHGKWSDWTALPSLPGGTTPEMIATGTDPAGNAYCFAPTPGAVFVNCNRTGSSTGWNRSWQSIGVPPGIAQIQTLAAGNDWGHGGLEVFILATDSGGDWAVYHSWLAAGSTSEWSAWAPLGAPGGAQIGDIATGNDAGNQALFLLAYTQDGGLSQIWPQQSSPTGWGDWEPFTSEGTKGAGLEAFAIASEKTGALPAVFAVSSGVLWACQRQPQSSPGWTDWRPLNGPQAWAPVSAPPLMQPPCGNADQLWAVTTAGEIYRSTNGGGAWAVEPFPSPDSPQQAASVSMGIDGTVWAVTALSSDSDPTSTCYRFTNGEWQQTATGNFVQAPVGTLQQLWTIAAGGSGNVLRSQDGGRSWSKDANVPAAVRQISVCAEGSVWAIDTGGNASLCQAWQRMMQPVQMPGYVVPNGCAEVAAGVNPHGDLYVFCADSKGLLSYTCEVGRHAWPDFTALPHAGEVSKLGVTRQQDTNELVAYGIGAGCVMIARQAAQRYSTYAATVCYASGFGMAPTDLELAAVDAGHWYWFALANGNLSAACVASDTLTPLAPIPFSALPGVWNLSQIVRLPWARRSPNPWLAVVDNSGTLQVVDMLMQPGPPYQAMATPLTGNGMPWPQGATSFAAVLQADNMGPSQTRFYAVAPAAAQSQALWVIRRVNVLSKASDAGVWSSWSPLGGSHLYLAPGSCLQATDTLFSMGSSTLSLTAVSQNKTTGKWLDGEVKRASRAGMEIEPVSMYYTEVTVANAAGIPQAGVAVTVTAEVPVLALIEGVAYELDPVRGVNCQTNGTGKLIVRTLAQGFYTPALTLQLSGTSADSGAAQTAAIQPSSHVYNFLAGSEQLPVGGGQPVLLCPATLQQGFKSVSHGTADFVVKNCKNISQLPGPGGSPVNGPVGFAVDRLNRAHPKFFTFWTAEELDAYRKEESWKLRDRGKADLSIGGIWHDIKHAAEDVVDGIKKGVITVETCTVDLAHKTVSLTLTVAGTIETVFEFVVHTVQVAALAMEAIVASMVAAIDAVIQWLRLLFDWENIIATQQALMGFINTLIVQSSDGIASVRETVVKSFDGLSDLFKTYMQQVIGKVSGDLSSLPQNWSIPTADVSGKVRISGNFLGGPLPSGASIAHMGWLLNKVFHSLTASFSFGSLGAFDPSEFLKAFNGDAIIQEFGGAFQSFWEGLKKFLIDPTQLACLALSDLIAGAADLVLTLLDFIEGLIVAVLDLIEAVLNGIAGVFNHAPHIPFVSALYKLVTGEDMTLLGAATLVIAIPFYILHRLLFNSNPFTGLSTEPGRMHDPAADIAPALWKEAYLALAAPNWMLNLLRDGLTCIRDGSSGIDLSTAQAAAVVMDFFAAIAAGSMLVCSWPDPKGFPNIVPVKPGDLFHLFTWLGWSCYGTMALYSVAAAATGELLASLKPLFGTAMGCVAFIFGTVAGGVGVHDHELNVPGLMKDLVAPWGSIPQVFLFKPIRNSIIDSIAVDPAWLNLALHWILNVAVPILGFEQAAMTTAS